MVYQAQHKNVTPNFIILPIPTFLQHASDNFPNLRQKTTQATNPCYFIVYLRNQI